MVAVMKSPAPPSRAEFHEAISNRSDRWYGACLKITRNQHLAEDAVQEALLSAWNKRHQFQHTARLETWIHRIAVNSALQLLRKNRPGVFEPFAKLRYTAEETFPVFLLFADSPSTTTRFLSDLGLTA